jgi:hypothetical protein
MTNDVAYRRFQLVANIDNEAPDRASLCKASEVGTALESFWKEVKNCKKKTVPTSKEPRIQVLDAA